IIQPPPTSPLFPYTTLFRSIPRRQARTRRTGQGKLSGGRRKRFMDRKKDGWQSKVKTGTGLTAGIGYFTLLLFAGSFGVWAATRSEEHTSELQSRENLVCRL